jgi:hypothetical protein
MEDWSQELIEMANTMAEAIEQFFQDIGQAIEEIAEQVQMEISSEIEYWWEEVEQPRREIHREAEDFFSDSFLDDSEFFNPKVEPTSETHPACIGCRHYHGRIYSGNLLVCGIHPYGWEDRDCPDWENR